MLEQTLNLLPHPEACLIYFTCALLIGMSKTGIPNIGTLAIPLFAFLFGAKASTGIVLILLCMADVIAVVYYRKEFLWNEVKKLLPMAILGLISALLIGNYINDQIFKKLIAVCILLTIGFMFWSENNNKIDDLVKNKWYSPILGFTMGFFTMIGNAAGPILSVYMLSKKLDKITFTATAAWFIMILNFTKIPLQLFVWKNITIPGLILNGMAFPFVLLGGYLGIIILKKIPEVLFKKIIITLIIISSTLLLIY